jgi:Iron-containing redox enzyme
VLRSVAQREGSLLGPSDRLRIKVELAAPALAMTDQILLRHPRAREVLPRVLAAGYQVARSAVPLMETALGRARELGPGDAVASQLVPYLERHIPEEMHGDEPGAAALEDLGALGVDTIRLRASLPRPKIAALVGAQYYWILEHHPVAVLGFLELESFHAEQPMVERLIEATGLPREGFRQLLLHAKLDIAHARELHRVIDDLPLEPYHERLIGLSALQTIALLSEVLLEVVEERVADGRAAPVVP